jgi:hypothetical protein
VSYSFTFSGEPIPVSSHQVGTLPYLNPSFGAAYMMSVALELAVTVTGAENQFQNLSFVSDPSVTLGVGATVTITARPSGLATTAVPMVTGTGSVAPYTGMLGYTGPDALTVGPGSGSDDQISTITGTNPFDPASTYIGTGSFGVDLTDSLQTSLASTGAFGPENPDVSGATLSGTVTITYVW